MSNGPEKKPGDLSNACTLAPKLCVAYEMKRICLLKTNQLARRIVFISLSKIISRDNLYVWEMICMCAR